MLSITIKVGVSTDLLFTIDMIFHYATSSSRTDGKAKDARARTLAFASSHADSCDPESRESGENAAVSA